MEPQRLKLQALTSRRDQLVAMRKAERIRLKGLPDPEIVESLREMLAVLDQQIRSLDRRIEAAVAQAPALARDAAILRSAPGIGAVASSILLACMPELGQVDRRAAAALAGLAPVARDSGLMRGKRHVQGGRKRIRDALYMAAVTAIRSEQFKPRYDRLRQAGKPSKLAIIAIARQLLVALNAAIRDQKAFIAMPA
jgi:transposase